MFERAVFWRSNQEGTVQLDIGQLAEAILYYGSVELLLDQSNLGFLVKAIGPEALIRLVQLPSVNTKLVTDNLGTVTNNSGFSTHHFVAFSLAKDDRKRPILTKQERVREVLERSLDSSFRVRKQADFISQFLTESSFASGLAGPNLIDGATADLYDDKFLTEAVKLTIQDRVPSFKIPDRFRFSPVAYGEAFIIDTDLDFTQLATEYQKYWPPTHSTLTPASLLSEILEAKASLGLSARFDADVFSSRTSSDLIKFKVKNFGNRQDQHSNEIADFSEWVLEGRSIGKALREEERTFHDFLDLVEKAWDFKQWVAGQGSDQSLAKEYFLECGKVGWLDRLPAKSLRYMAFTGLSTAIGFVATPLVSVAAGAALSAIDSFAFDRLLKGWKPSHFVDGRLKPFLRDSSR